MRKKEVLIKILTSLLEEQVLLARETLGLDVDSYELTIMKLVAGEAIRGVNFAGYDKITGEGCTITLCGITMLNALTK